MEPFEQALLELLRKPKKAPPRAEAPPQLSEEKRRLLALRLSRRAAGKPPATHPWFPAIHAAPKDKLRLFCFPWAGGGALPFRSWSSALEPAAFVVAVRLPGRESRASEPPYERMEPLLDALLEQIRPFLDAPFAFFGH